MKFFIDSADVNDIQAAKDYGFLDGVTTNPSLVSKVEGSLEQIVSDISNVADMVPISVEVLSTDFEDMKTEINKLRKLDAYRRIVIKLPLTLDGLKATKWCSDSGIPTNVTLCFSPLQALLAAKAGATYISPFVGRLDDISYEGMELVHQIIEIYQNYGYDTQVLVASVRHPIHVLEAARAGADIVTLPLDVLEKLAKHPLTDIGLNKFLSDSRKTK